MLMKLENMEKEEQASCQQLSLLINSLQSPSASLYKTSGMSQEEARIRGESNLSSTSSITDSVMSSSKNSIDLTRRRSFSTGSIELPKSHRPILGASPVVSQLSENSQHISSHRRKSRTNCEAHARPTRKSEVTAPAVHQEEFGRPRGATMADIESYKGELRKNSAKSESEDCLCRTYVNPFFLFLQMFYNPSMSSSTEGRPTLLENNEVIERSIKMFDRLPAYDTHKFGVIFVGKNQTNEIDILSNEFGSSRYLDFLSGLGSLIKIADASPTDIYTGGLDRNGTDGLYAYHWHDHTTQVIYHTATLMPNKESDPACHSKKRHIGNNFVTIVYDESKRGYSFGTLKGQFNFAEVVIQPRDYESNIVFVRVKDALKDKVPVNCEQHVISDKNLPLLVRQLAIHTNMATVLENNQKRLSDAYGGNWLERLRQLKRIQSKANVGGESSHQAQFPKCDFTDFCFL